MYIEKKTMEIEEKGVRLRLTVVDTPGFGDALNCEDSWRAIEKYIDEQFNQFFRDESGLNRKNIVDNRVHCCLYFIPPWGHGLRQLDVEFMKRLHKKVSLRKCQDTSHFCNICRLCGCYLHGSLMSTCRRIPGEHCSGNCQGRYFDAERNC